MRRYDLASLLAASGLTESGLTRRAGLSGSSLVAARQRGLTEAAADRFAVRCGLHPSQVWPDYGIVESQVTCPGCDEPFLPVRRSHRYCTKQCYQRTYKKVAYRQKYATNPEFRERELARSRERRESERRVTALKKAAYYRRNRERILARKRERYYAAKETAA